MMNAEDSGQHASGYRRSEPDELSRGFMFRLVFWAIVFACCIGWVMSHAGCAHPIENGLAALTGFVFVPLRLLCLVLSEAGADE
jgi:hypothetical protein